MTNLKDYLSSLVTGINQARMLADFESARIAQIYAQDEILKTFSVPRFRLPDVELTVPVAIEALESEPEKDYQPIDNRSFTSIAYNVIKEHMGVDSFNRIQSNQIRGLLFEETAILEKSLQSKGSIEQSLGTFSKNVARSFWNIINDAPIEQETNLVSIKKKEGDFSSNLVNELQERLRPEIHLPKASDEISNAKIIAEAHHLREMDPKSIIQIKMKLSEEGMEWTKIDKEDGTHDLRLIPE